MAVGLAMAKGLEWGENATLTFAFRWTGLSGRELDPWGNREAYFSMGRTAHEDTAQSCVEVPIDTPPSALPPYVEQALQPLFVLFDGFSMPTPAIEHWVQRLIERRL
jgi:hypothetical protein